MIYRMLDPELNVDLCCCGALKAIKGVYIIGCLEIIGVIAVCVKAFVTSLTSGHWPVPLWIIITVITIANFITIFFMFFGLKHRRASFMSYHLIVHVINVVGLVFVLLISATFVVGGSAADKRKFAAGNNINGGADFENGQSTGSGTISDRPADFGYGINASNVQWAVQLIVSTICVLVETWFFNVEYTVFLQLCERRSDK